MSSTHASKCTCPSPGRCGGAPLLVGVIAAAVMILAPLAIYYALSDD